MKKQFHARGFTLVEVMLALLILALGILGISKLQGTLIKNTTDANQRAVAVSLAQKKIDDLRSYAELGLTGVSDWACPGTPLSAASLAYADIADNAGGAPLCDANFLADTDVQIGNTIYELAWDVTPYQFVANVATAMSDASSAAPTLDFKEVEVSVSWLDVATGNDSSVTLSTILDAYNPALTALSGATNAGGKPIYTNYTPEAAPDVIDIEVDTGAGSKRQTSKPLPDAIKQGQNANTVVTFDVVTYQTNPIDPTKFTQTRQEEYTNVDCKCRLSGTGFAFPPAHAVWDDTNKERYDYVGSPINKQTAVPVNNANAANELCTTCCRDHHDSDASPVKYVAGTTSGNHVHYKANGQIASGTDEYVESCRLKLVNGVRRVYQDWQILDFTVLQRSKLSDGQPLQTQYRTYVDRILKNQIETPVATTKPALRTPVTLALGALEQMESRGVYLDKVYDLSGSLSSEYSSYVGNSSNLDRLEKVPFAEVNLTLLSKWNSTDTTGTKVTVTNEPVATVSDPINNYYGSYSRGLINAKGAAPSPGIPVLSSIHPNNQGFTQKVVNLLPPLSFSDSLAVIVDGAAPSPVMISGSINGAGLPGGTKFGLTGCSIVSGGGGKNFACTKASGTNVEIIATASYEVTTGTGQNRVTTTVNCVGSFKQNNVQSNISGISIGLTCS